MKIKTQDDKKLIYFFGIMFSLLMLVTMVFEWALPRIGWLRALNDSWSDLRVNSPIYASALFSGSDENNDFGFGFGKYITKRGDPRILIAAIDNHTLNNLGYPFPRKHYGELIEKLNKLGARAVVMDVLTIDPDKNHAASDVSYINSVKKAGNVVASMGFDRWNKTFQIPIKGIPEASAYVAIPNMDKILSTDNKVRKVYLFDPDATYSDAKKLKTPCHGLECGSVNLAGLASAAYATYTKTPLPEVWVKYGSEEAYYLNFRYPVVRRVHEGWSKETITEFSVYPWVSVLDIIEGKLSPAEKSSLKGAIVMVGSVALGAYDHYPSPFMVNMPGVEIHANALDNMLNNDFLQPVNGWLVAFMVLTCIWLSIFLRKHSIALLTTVVLGTLGAAVVADFYLLHKLYNLMFAHVAVALLLPYVFITVHKAIIEGREKKWIKNTFGQYLSPKVVEIITKDPSKLMLGGEKRDMTAMFCDIAGFTTISEKLTPEQLTAMLNIYLSGLTDVILTQDGVVDKFIGDCIMAFWNAPLDLKNHRTNALFAAVDCVAVNDRLNAESKDKSIQPMFRVGLNSGPMIVGNMGSKNRFSYTAIGDSVNLASRLEGANKFFHSRIMASESVFDEAKDLLDARYLGQIRVVGKAIPVKVYEPLARKGQASPEVAKMLPLYAAGLAHFNAGKYKEAAKDFAAALAARPSDGPSRFYLDLADKYAVEVPEGWDGTFNLDSK